MDLPGDVLYRVVEENDVMYPKKPHTVPRISGDEDLIKEAIALLKGAERPVGYYRHRHYLVGRHARTERVRGNDGHSVLHHAARPRCYS